MKSTQNYLKPYTQLKTLNHTNVVSILPKNDFARLVIIEPYLQLPQSNPLRPLWTMIDGPGLQGTEHSFIQSELCSALCSTAIKGILQWKHIIFVLQDLKDAEYWHGKFLLYNEACLCSTSAYSCTASVCSCPEVASNLCPRGATLEHLAACPE